MKSAILFLSLVMTCSIAFSQTSENGNFQRFSVPAHGFGDFSISASPQILFNTPNALQFAGGLKLRLFMGKRISFDSDVVFGRDYIHGGPGLIGIPVWLLVLGGGGTGDEERPISDLLFIAAAMILSAEHISYHIPIKGSTEISPYISCLKYKSAYEYGHYSNTNRTNEQLCGTLGLEVNKYFNRFLLSPFIECNIGYVDHNPQVNAGLYCGYYIINKRNR
jgi:hypothetical protein